MDNNLISVEYDNNRILVSGRELHRGLGIKTDYTEWFPRMCKYGFTEGVDFNFLKFGKVQKEGNRLITRDIIDHQLTIDMAKEICMIQRSEKGKEYRKYFIELEKKWNTPEAVMARALQMANEQLEKIKTENSKLVTINQAQEKQIEVMKPKVSYYDKVMQCKDLMTITMIAKDFGMTAAEMNQVLHQKKVQYKQSGQWFLYSKYQDKGYCSSKTNVYETVSGFGVRTHTYWTQKGRLFIYNLLKEDGILPLIERPDIPA